MMKHIRDFFSVVFKIDEYHPERLAGEDSDAESEEGENCMGDDKLVLTCVGTGFVNFSKGNI